MANKQNGLAGNKMKKGGYILIKERWSEFGKEISLGLIQIKKRKIPKWKQILLTNKFLK